MRKINRIERLAISTDKPRGLFKISWAVSSCALVIDLRHTVHEMKPLVLLLEGKQVISVCKVTLCFPSYTCSFIKIFRMTIKMAKHPITMTIMRMTSTPGTVRLCCCCYRYNFFFVFICFVCFFFQLILNSFLIPVEQITASNLRVLSPNWFVNSFAYFLFVCSQTVIWAFRKTSTNNYLH